jgi:hypothetical protein
MHVVTENAAARPSRDLRPSRVWTVHAMQRISGAAEDGMRAIVPTGTYLLKEIDEITYELRDSMASPLLTLRLSEVAAHCRSGALSIDGMWP